jgi:hypothetical protein
MLIERVGQQMTGDSSYDLLFPVAGITMSVWLVVLGVAGLRVPDTATSRAAIAG